MNSRTVNAKKNITSGIILIMLSTIMTFILRTVFIKALGENCLGLSSLYTNILSMLNLTELGLTTAIGFSLYEKLANSKTYEISCLMSYYKRVYRIIGLIILIAGLLLLPFLSNFITGTNVDNYQLIFLIYLLDTVFSYLFSYKEILLESDQSNYKAVVIRFFSVLLMNIFEIIILTITKNFVLYAFTFLICNNIGKITLNIYISRKYKHINFNQKDKIDSEERKNLKVNIGAMLCHKIGDYLVNGTDNIIVSKFINLATVGFYTNYLSLISIIRSLISSIYSSIVSSLGNLIVKEKIEVRERIFKITDFVSFILGGLFTVCFYNCSSVFIELWIGEKYILSPSIVLVICINFYLFCILLPVNSFKMAAGLYKYDKFVPLIQAIINLVFSIILVKPFGLLGVLLGTLISYLATISWIKPYIIYKYVLKKNVIDYYKKQIFNIILLLIVFIISNFIIRKIVISSLILKFIIYGLITSIIYLFIIIIAYYRRSEFQYFKDIIKNKLFVMRTPFRRHQIKNQ